MPRRRVTSVITFVCVAAFAAGLGGCTKTKEMFDTSSEGSWFSKPMDIFAKPDWARPHVDAKSVQLGASGPVPSEDLVAADGQCAPPTAEAAQASAAPSAAAVTTATAAPPSDRLEGGGLQAPAAAPVLGGIALGMTECQAVRRGGQPSSVAISAGDKGERKTVVTYLGGSWPGIYTFQAGRLKVIDRVPEPEKPKQAPRKKKPARAKTASQPSRAYVQ